MTNVNIKNGKNSFVYKLDASSCEEKKENRKEINWEHSKINIMLPLSCEHTACMNMCVCYFLMLYSVLINNEILSRMTSLPLSLSFVIEMPMHFLSRKILLIFFSAHLSRLQDLTREEKYLFSRFLIHLNIFYHISLTSLTLKYYTI